MRKKIILISIFIIFTCGIAFATDTIIQNFANLVSDNDGSYQNQKMQTVGNNNLRFINKDADTNYVGDYFAGHYYDPAYGIFQTNAVTERVRISNMPTNRCLNNTTHVGYKLEWYSYSPSFGFMNFNHNSNIFTYVCIPKDFDSEDTHSSYLWWYAYNPLIGFQNFDGWIFDSSVDICDPNVDIDCISDDDAEWKYLRVEWVVSSSKSQGLLTQQFHDDIRILWDLTKSNLRKDIHRKVYSTIKNISNTSWPWNITNLSWDTWYWSVGWEKIMWDKVLFFKNPSSDVIISGTNLSGIKTLVVENGDILINGNIIWDGILGLIVLNGNIRISPTVTDIHAIMYTDRSIISDGINLYTTNEEKGTLKNQLFIKGSIFSENTIWASKKSPPECPYYINSWCTTMLEAEKYDLNYLRRYKLVQPVDTNANPIWDKVPQYGWVISTTLPSGSIDYSLYPLVIKYNPLVQETPPPFFN